MNALHRASLSISLTWLEAMAALVIPPAVCQALTPTAYHVTDLGTLGGEYSVALGINDSGQITGHSQTTTNANTNAFLWAPTNPNGVSGTMHDLGRRGGQFSAGKTSTAAVR
jgi:probable HAF family extracellular repeat protein